MDTGAITPPPGYSIEQSPASTLPPGYTLEQANQQSIPAQSDDEIPETSYGAATWGAIKNLGKDTLGAITGAAKSLDPTPQDSGEEGAHAAGGIGAMLIYRTLKGLGETAIQAHEIPAAIHDINQSSDPIGTYAKIIQKTASQGAGQAITALATEGAAKGLAAGASAVSGGEEPGIVSQVIKGKGVAQPAAQAALREGATAGASEAGVSTVQPASLRESLTNPINAGEAQAKSLYNQIDTASGTDFKALNQKLRNTNRQIRMLGDTAEDQAAEAKLETARTGLIDKIQSAKNDAIAKGVDPKTLGQADSQFKQTEAMRDVETKVFKNPDIVQGNSAMGSEEVVNVDKAIKAFQKLQDSEKYGAPRLEQAFGKDGANQILLKLYQAQRQGVHALKAQQVAKWVAGVAGAGAAAKGISALSSKGASQ